MSKEKLIRFLYWVLYISLCFISGWFSSEGITNYFSQSTSFYQSEEINDKWPVITINLDGANTSVKYGNNTWIYYGSGYNGLENIPQKLLKFGKNIFQYKKINKTDIVFLDKYKYYNGIFRIIPLTKLSEENPYGEIQIITLKELHIDVVTIDFASLENSLGSIFSVWNDGRHLSYTIKKNHFKVIFIKPDKYVYLPQISKCHDESYYDCIVSELDKMDFNLTFQNDNLFKNLQNLFNLTCFKKCIPDVFSYGKNFSTPFCQKEDEDFCARRIAINMIEIESKTKTYSRCKHSCKILQYHGVELTEKAIPLENLQVETMNEYGIFYDFAYGDNAPPHQVSKSFFAIHWKFLGSITFNYFFLDFIYFEWNFC